MKRILLITESLGSGGAERQICGLAALLTKQRYTCKLITYFENQFYESYLMEHGVDYEFVPSLLNKYTRVIKLIKYFYKYQPDVVISYLPSVNITACLARIFYRCRLIVSERNNNSCVKIYDRLLFNLYRMADYVVPNSNSQGEFIKHNFPSLETKVRTITNFVDFEKFAPLTIKACNEIPHIITVARVTEQKNVLTFIDVIGVIKQKGIKVHFDWFGSKNFNSAYNRLVENKVLELGIEDYVTFNDASEDIVSEYQKSDIFCLPSLFEGYPNVIVEAMCCELPILCSRIFENPYIVEDGKNGFLFDPMKVEDMVLAIENMLSLTKEQRLNMGKINRQKCVLNNNEEAFKKKYIELIENE